MLQPNRYNSIKMLVYFIYQFWGKQFQYEFVNQKHVDCSLWQRKIMLNMSLRPFFKGWRRRTMQCIERSDDKFEDINSGLPYGLVVRIPGFHPGGPGSIPGVGTSIFVQFDNYIPKNSKLAPVRKGSTNERKTINLSEVGFEPTPGRPDCDLNAAPQTARPS